MTENTHEPEAMHAPEVETAQPSRKGNSRRRTFRFYAECASTRHFARGNTENAARRRLNEFCGGKGECKGDRLIIDFEEKTQ